MRARTSLTTLLTLALAACGDNGGGTTTQTTQTSATDSTATDPSAGTTTAASGGTTTDAPTTMNPTTTSPTTTSPTTTGDDASAGTTTNATTGTTTTDPSAGTTSDGTTGTTTDASGTTTDASGTSTGGTGEDLYGPCAMGNPPCPAMQDCIMITGIDGSFCAPTCEGMDCPAVPAGVKAEAMCVLTQPMEMDPTLCALICNPKAMVSECPDGETCKQVPMQVGVGLCTAP